MKRLLVFLLVLVIATVAMAKPRIKDFTVASGNATNPQTISFVTTYGFQPQGLVVVAPDGGCMLKFKGIGGRANFWKYVWAGTSFEIKPSISYPVDSLTILRDATSSGFSVTGYGGE